jgi:hypothetical protein
VLNELDRHSRRGPEPALTFGRPGIAAYLIVVILYTVAALGLTVFLHGDWQQTLSEFLQVALKISRSVLDTQVKAILVVVPILWWYWRGKPAVDLRSVVFVAIAATVLQVGFFFMKAAIPALVPFYADPFLADLEKALFLGHDAWELTHAITPTAVAAWFPTVYSTIWTLLAYAFPIFVVATDRDPLRVRRYLWLFFLTWVVLGNILATAGSSVGPIYYDRLLGTDRFAALHASLDEIGREVGSTSDFKDMLWDLSVGKLSFISAFPSVHVAIACVAALYVRERYPGFRLLGDLFLAVILLISVHSGYHYLLDGIASIAVVLALNAGLRKVGRRGPEGPDRLPSATGPGMTETDSARHEARSAHLP